MATVLFTAGPDTPLLLQIKTKISSDTFVRMKSNRLKKLKNKGLEVEKDGHLDETEYLN